MHEFYLMCDDVAALVGEPAKRSVRCDPVRSMGWGLLTQVTLPGGGKLGVYEPRHARPKSMRVAKAAARKPGRRGAANRAKRRV